MNIYIVTVNDINQNVCTCFDLAKEYRKLWIKHQITNLQTPVGYESLNIDPTLLDKEKEIIILSTAYNSVGIEIYEQRHILPVEELRYVRTDRLLYTSGEAH
jgi:hypothetical protein